MWLVPYYLYIAEPESHGFPIVSRRPHKLVALLAMMRSLSTHFSGKANPTYDLTARLWLEVVASSSGCLRSNFILGQPHILECWKPVRMVCSDNVCGGWLSIGPLTFSSVSNVKISHTDFYFCIYLFIYLEQHWLFQRYGSVKQHWLSSSVCCVYWLHFKVNFEAGATLGFKYGGHLETQI